MTNWQEGLVLNPKVLVGKVEDTLLFRTRAIDGQQYQIIGGSWVALPRDGLRSPDPGAGRAVFTCGALKTTCTQKYSQTSKTAHEHMMACSSKPAHMEWNDHTTEGRSNTKTHLLNSKTELLLQMSSVSGGRIFEAGSDVE